MIAKALRENVNFMWLSDGNRPDFPTINTFRWTALKDVIGEVFVAVVESLVESGHQDRGQRKQVQLGVEEIDETAL